MHRLIVGEVMPKPLTLYGRAHCHLCELAQEILQASGMSAQLIDIDADPELGARYGLRIPVLRYPDGRELDWPFSLDTFLLIHA